MSTQPRIAFSSFPSAGDAQFAVWQRVNSRILGAGVAAGAIRNQRVVVLTEEPTPHAAPRGVWQLLAANNRELGRSARAYPSFHSAVAHVEEIRESVAILALRVDRHRHLDTWYWVAEHGIDPVITSGRLFDSAAEAAKTATGALLALAQATVDAVPRSRPGRRRGNEPTRERGASVPW